MTFFHKAVVFTDAHFGRGGDSPIANQDNLDFLDWMIDRARSWGAETCVFCGDWYHNRSSIGVTSLDAGRAGLEKLSAAFGKTIVLIGNHDIAQRRSREVSSLNFAGHLPNTRLITEPVVLDDVAFLPWLMEGEHIPQARYGFAHLETIGAMMNARIECTGGQHAVDASSFSGFERVYTGHFHARQTLKNISYIGNIFPFDFGDANDAARGVMFLQWGHEPVFEPWPEQPLYHVSPLSRLLDNLDVLRPKMTVRTTVDIDLRYEEAQQIRDLLITTYGLRKVELLHAAPADVKPAETVELHTVDQIVIDGLRQIESVGLSSERLVEIYNGLARQ